MKRIVILVLALWVFSVSAAEQTSVFEAYHRGNYEQAKKGLWDLAKQDNKAAYYYLANMYLYGYGVSQSQAKGLELMTRSASLDYLPAQMYLGQYYFQRKQNLAKAVNWFKKAAQADNKRAQLFVGLAYLKGLGVTRNSDRARKYIIMAAKNGIPMAEYELAELFLNNKYSNDKKMGRIWLFKAARKGYPDAQYRLGQMLYVGKRIKKDQAKGVEWLTKAAQNNNLAAKAMLEKINDGTLVVLKPTNNNKKKVKEKSKKVDKIKLTPKQQWQAMEQDLQKAKLPLVNPKVTVAIHDSVTMTPKLIQLNKASIIKTAYQLISPKNMPMAKIITYMNKMTYLQEKPKFYAQSYPFVLPAGAQNEQEAFQLLSRQARFGFVPALFKLAQMYEKGLSVKKDPKKAYALYLKAAENNYLKAQYRMGLYYLYGDGVERNYNLAVDWFAKAALHGSAQAQFILGNIYEYGINRKGDPNYIAREVSQAQAMYSLAAHNQLAMAQFRLAQLYASGMLNPNKNVELQKRDLKLAYELYFQAAEKGVEEAKIALAYFYAGKNQDLHKQKEAFQIVEKAAKSGYQNAILLLAILYDRGIGVDEDTGKAVDLYEKLANDNNVIAEFMLGTHYYLDDEKEKAVRLLVKAARAGSVYAQYNLAILAKKGDYQETGQDFVSLLTQAANHHFNQASILLADYYMMNSTANEGVEKAAKIYRQLAEKQDSTAELKLGFMYERGIHFPQDDQKAFEWYQRSAHHDNPIGQYLLGNMYQFGKGIPRNISLAIKYYKKSAQQQYVPAFVGLGYVYEVDKHNYAQAQQWYLKAVNANNAFAEYNLGLMYEYGKGLAVNYLKAFQLYQKASKNGYSFAEYNLAKMYLSGLGVDEDVDEALKWYQKAAEQNESVALYQLGLMSESGVGQDINFNQARSYYEKAAQKGNNKAQLALARMYEYGEGILADKTKAMDYYRLAAADGNGFAAWKLKVLNDEAVTQPPQFCVQESIVTQIKKSFWKKLLNKFRSNPDIVYMNAINELNKGDIGGGTFGLRKVMEQNPGFNPAKKVIAYYICKTQTPKQAQVNPTQPKPSKMKQ